MDAKIVCAIQGCGIHLMNPCGHTLCCRDAPCSKGEDGVTYWSRFDCQVCCDLWFATSGSDKVVHDLVVASSRSWVLGFSRNKPSPYLGSWEFLWCALSKSIESSSDRLRAFPSFVLCPEFGSHLSAHWGGCVWLTDHWGWGVSVGRLHYFGSCWWRSQYLH